MNYLLLVYNDEKAWTEKEREKCFAESTQLTHELHAQGHYRGAAPLHPVAAATSVRVRQGKRLVTDGPFAETHEQLGGYFMIEARDLDEAIEIAGRIPGARKGTVEVRPVVAMPGLPDLRSPTKEIAVQANPYLLFDGQCEAAFQFYAKCLGGKIEAMIPHEGTPAETAVSPDWLKKIMHARMTVGDTVLMASDCPPDRFQKPQGFSVALQIKDPAEAERVFHALAQNGTMTMPIQETFWAIRFGMLVDQFGIPWMINCQREG